MPPRRPSALSRKWLFALVTLVGVGLLFELTARVTLARLDARPRRAGHLDSYEMQDPHDSSLWRLKPGFSATMDELIASKHRQGKELAERHYAAAKERLSIPGDAVVLRVNGDGYRGPELLEQGAAFRLLTLGDSCTFGTIGDYSYPRVLERELARVAPVEVVNAGVEGYGPRQILARLDEFIALRPDLTLIHVGWNALFAESIDFLPDKRPRPAPPRRVAGPRSVELVRRVFLKLATLGGERRAALEAYAEPKRPDRDDPALALLDGYTPWFLDEIEAIATRMRASGSLVVLTTLPALYRTDLPPSPAAMEIGHLPRYTNNPYVLAKLAERYNQSLRELADRQNLPLVDLEAWSRRELRPPEEFFFDSVHLKEEAQRALGLHLAAELVRGGWVRRPEEARSARLVPGRTGAILTKDPLQGSIENRLPWTENRNGSPG